MDDVKFVVWCFCWLFTCSMSMSMSIVGGGPSPCTVKPLLFNFGDSNSDTGGAAVLRGILTELPKGRTFFQESTGRSCDGRLILDFLCERLGTKYLTPYFELFTADYSNGVNFALSSSDTLRTDKENPLTLHNQILQFQRFRNISIRRALFGADQFRNNAIYLIDIGQNDIDGNFNLKPFAKVLNDTRTVVSNIKAAIKSIYDVGGRNFWVHNTGPAGCLPKNIARRNASTPIDNNGCIARINQADVKFNSELECMCRELRLEMDDAAIVYVDVHSIKLDLIVNAASYGFGDPFTACYNATAGTVCPEAEAEAEGGRFISWDGVHYTEAANMFVASKILSTNFSTPPLTFNFFCN